MSKRKSFAIPGYAYETVQEIVDTIKRRGPNNIHQSVSTELDRSDLTVVHARSVNGRTHNCDVKVEIREVPGQRQTEVVVVDNDWGPSCSRDGHIEFIASELQQAYFDYYSGYTSTQRRR